VSLLDTLRAYATVVAAVAGVALGALVGGGLTWLVMDRALARVEADVAKAETLRATAVAERVEQVRAAEQRADVVAADLVRTKDALAVTEREKIDAINKVATGKPCLGARTVRVLNSNGPALGGAVPGGTGSAAGSAPSAPGDTPGFASDRAVAEWIARAQQSYEACRAQVAAIGTATRGE
jgi:3-hydroxyacyl-CoA dehydrogenase